jgi:cyclophilin family peptidyl-prolyl cis-trans isomerase
MKALALCAAAATLLFAACGSDSKTSKTPTAAATGTATGQLLTQPTLAPAKTSSGSPTTGGTAAVASPTKAAATTPAAQATQSGGKKTYSSRPPLTIDKSKKYFATIKMDIGDIRLELFANEAPETVNSFVFLARDGFYDGLTFHRVIPGFVAQGGDPTGTGRGGPGYQLPDEHNSHKFLDGAMGMATSGPNTAGSQFFIDYAPQPNLDGGYTVFGQIVSGRDVLDKITPRDPTKATTPGTKINTIVIEEQ